MKKCRACGQPLPLPDTPPGPAPDVERFFDFLESPEGEKVLEALFEGALNAREVQDLCRPYGVRWQAVWRLSDRLYAQQPGGIFEGVPISLSVSEIRWSPEGELLLATILPAPGRAVRIERVHGQATPYTQRSYTRGLAGWIRDAAPTGCSKAEALALLRGETT